MNGDIYVSSSRTNPLDEGLNQTSLFRVGCLMWLANQTRTGIANAVRAVARNTSLPRNVHRKTAVGIFLFTGML